ncbi:nonribosomal peptide synthetase/polyketide synthase [Escherichia coli]|nr:nonribosomal peptide synthetase/polyketide synthase [Escherichia coli]KAA2157079.1 nonribosomal peptide synthetase/polyketide synthase [Escherichia coli]RXC00562.1 nonribosomal peptide synthetase/polyketide synthase [Escherichia coli]
MKTPVATPRSFAGNHVDAVFTPAGVTNGAIVIHTQRLKSDPGGNLLS